MIAPHPTDWAEALKWAEAQAKQNTSDPMVRLIYLPALTCERQKAERAARGG